MNNNDEQISELRYRMYGLTLYNISEIQKGIQFGHAVVEYGLKYFNTNRYQQWAKNDKTFIILNGGTTNQIGTTPYSEAPYKGSIDLYLEQLNDIGIVATAEFYEPDLNNAMTAFCFLVDERIWDKEKYPDYDTVYNKQLKSLQTETEFGTITKAVHIPYQPDPYYYTLFGAGYNEILKLRAFLSSFRLA